MLELIKLSERAFGSLITAILVGMLFFILPKLCCDGYKFIVNSLNF